MLDLEHIKATLAGARHPEWFIGPDHQCGDGILAVYDADPDSFSFESEADAAIVCGGISPDDEGRARFIAAAPTHIALLLAQVEALTAQVEANRARYEDARRERDEYRDLAQTRAEVGRRALEERDAARAEVTRLQGELTRRCGIVYHPGDGEF